MATKAFGLMKRASNYLLPYAYELDVGRHADNLEKRLGARFPNATIDRDKVEYGVRVAEKDYARMLDLARIADSGDRGISLLAQGGDVVLLDKLKEFGVIGQGAGYLAFHAVEENLERKWFIQPFIDEVERVAESYGIPESKVQEIKEFTKTSTNIPVVSDVLDIFLNQYINWTVERIEEHAHALLKDHYGNPAPAVDLSLPPVVDLGLTQRAA